MHALLSDYAHLAQQRLPAAVWQYLAEGSCSGGFGAMPLMPRPLADVRGGHTRLQLFGQPLAHPVLLAPVAYQRLFHPEGEIATAMAAQAQQAPMVISSLASLPLAAIAQAARPSDGQAGDGSREGHGELGSSGQGAWFQLYWQGDRARTLRLLQRAIDAGCSVIVFTVDAPIKQASLQLPAGISAVNLEAPLPLVSAGSKVFDGWMQQAPLWQDVAWLRQQTRLPLLLKGILHPDDAARARAEGIDGIIVSDHGGRVLPGSVSGLQALPQICARLDGSMPVLFDSGIRSGFDTFIALALGASAVLVGRPYIWGLAANGAMGVAQVIRVLLDELEMCMALTGCASVAQIGRANLALAR
ncbi:MAG: hypothetical protein RL748_2973 [Pseudomonadota bacterium]|jgi:4-hydroxymandelate oxidase